MYLVGVGRWLASPSPSPRPRPCIIDTRSLVLTTRSHAESNGSGEKKKRSKLHAYCTLQEGSPLLPPIPPDTDRATQAKARRR